MSKPTGLHETLEPKALEAAFQAYLEFARTDPDYPHEQMGAICVIIAAYLAALPSPGSGEQVSPSDPLTILAGIEQFGLAADGSDLRDLRAALAQQAKPQEKI